MLTHSMLSSVIAAGSLNGLSVVATQALNRFNTSLSTFQPSATQQGNLDSHQMRPVPAPSTPSSTPFSTQTKRSLFISSSPGSIRSAIYARLSASVALHPYGVTGIRTFDTLAHSIRSSVHDAGGPELVAAADRCLIEGVHDPQVLGAIAERAAGLLDTMDPEHTRRLMLVFAELGYRNTGFKSRLADSLVARLQDYSAEQLADVLWAYGQLDFYDFGLMEAVVPHVQNNAELFSACSMSKVLWTLSRCGYYDERMADFVHGMVENLKAGSEVEPLADVVLALSQMGWDDPHVQAMVADHALPRLAEFRPAGLAKLMYGLANMGYDDKQFFAAASDRVLQLLEVLQPQDLTRALWACGEMGHYNKELLDSVADDLLPAQVDSFSPDQLDTIISAFNKLGYVDSRVGALLGCGGTCEAGRHRDAGSIQMPAGDSAGGSQPRA